ncbi:MAG TPA: phage tail tape measure protein [Polyangiaceae bacterium]|nr:phage tail tape measure protein [Polyangiaceae bacterium]
MALNNLGLGFVFTARNLASGTINRVGRDLRGLGVQSRLSGQAMRAGFGIAAAGAAGLVVGIGALAGAMALADASAEFEQGLAAVGAVSNATREELALLRQSAIDAGIATQFSPTEAIEGLTSLATAGQTARQATETLVPVLDLAAGSLGQLGVGEAANSVVGTLNAYQLSATEAGNVTDRLLRITQLSNFQARDFASGLSTAAATGAVFGQELNDVLITMGLLRNRNIGATRAATAFREATRRLASDQRSQQAVTATGVDVFDQQTGEMRSVVDILGDLRDATADQTTEQRNATIARALGARGLLAFNAVADASFTTIRDGREVTLEGTAAIEAMRNEMEDASGTAASFRDQLLDTLAGQRTLLQGTLQTFAVVLGEPFARVFKPFVGSLVEGLNVLLSFFNELPEGMKTAIAGMFVATAVTTALGGAFAILVGLMVVVAPFLEAIAIAALSLLAVLAPVVLSFGAIVAGVLAFRHAIETNVGGVGEFVHRVINRVVLAFRAFGQLFSQGGFSGEVREELNRAENSGLRRFVVNVGRIAFRVMQFFRGMREGFSAGLQTLGPALERMVGAFTRLGEALGLVGSEGAEAAASIPSREFVTVGARIGNFFAGVFEMLVNGITQAARFFTGFVEGVQEAFTFLAPLWTQIGRDVSGLATQINELFIELGLSSDTGEDGMVSFGRVVGNVVGLTIGFFGSLIGAGAFLARHLVAAFRWIRSTWQDVADFIERSIVALVVSIRNMIDNVLNGVDRLVSGAASIASRIPPALRTEEINSVIAAGSNADARIAGREANITARNNGLERFRANQEARRSAAEEDVAARTSRDDGVAAAVTAALESQRLREQKARQEQPINIAVQVDGETIARAVRNGERSDAAAGFVPVPSENG